MWALLDAGASEVSVYNRTTGRAEALAAELGARAVAGPVAADILVNCTSVGLGYASSAVDFLKVFGITLDDFVNICMWLTSYTATARRGSSSLHANSACRSLTGSMSSSPRAHSASSCGPDAPRHARTCVALSWPADPGGRHGR